MMYKKYSLAHNLIIIVLALAVSVSFFACSEDLPVEESVTSSEDSSETISVPEELKLSRELAIELIERDKLVTEIFICNALCDEGNTSAVAVPVSSENKYSSFSEIKSLLNETYAVANHHYFLNYPQQYSPSVSEVDGKTYVFNHTGSDFDDFIDTSTVSVIDTVVFTQKVISAKTVSGKEVELMVYKHDNVWVLEKGLYFSYPYEAERCETVVPLTNLGSLSSLSGNTLVIELFVSDNKTSFESADESAFHAKIKSAFDYFTAQAESYGASLSVEYESAYFTHDGVMGDRALDFDIIFAETGFGTLQKFAELNYDLTKYDNYCFVICFNKEFDTDYRMFKNTIDTQAYYSERVLIGTQSTDTEICHALLLALGAYDYNGSICDTYTESLYDVYFPNDIMNSNDLSSGQISPVTAYVCGITNDLDPFFRVFLYE